MGRQIEQMAINRGHNIVAVIDAADDFMNDCQCFRKADVAIDFSTPETAVENIFRFFDQNLPVVVGTTGWYDRLAEVEERCIEQKQSLLYSPNMSIGANLFFELNSWLSEFMRPYSNYRPTIEERHHVKKQDMPSGTAIMLAQDILLNNPELKEWTLNPIDTQYDKLPVVSIREGDITGYHEVKYHSDIDEIAISHTALNRNGFALGAVCAAEWLPGHYGVFTMKHVIRSLTNL
jgi:4-hydroxy-tetrahydrodipicolinate reductase